jgi:hypothetical protein
MIYLGQLGYTGLYLGTPKSGWDIWWLLLDSAHNPKGKTWICGGEIPATAYSTKHLDWWVAARIITLSQSEVGD